MSRDPNVKGYLITENAVTTNNPKIVEDTGRSTSILAVLQEADIPNRNKRVYGLNVLQEAIKSDYVTERLKTKSFYGEAGK
jgi:hypothetical protein